MSLIVHKCQQPGCYVMIRDQMDSAVPYCRWHVAGIAYNVIANKPAGMPDHGLPWPWLTDTERERHLRLPYWRGRFVAAAERYAEYRKWIRKT